eukprot:CAMPEP_0115019306 /NCGR_PEP_ID=MMETSP0216-20121206/29359_1 /TAXON_ID=223996 /ORGANISM="Protocruzia adherens, Strain Boccale" /LENGTH=447 /DNA_ID=CAMNT_0002390739 /DNA_START=45 /DNA_END=1388 /DNA_ORIENTATION=+
MQKSTTRKSSLTEEHVKLSIEVDAAKTDGDTHREDAFNAAESHTLINGINNKDPRMTKQRSSKKIVPSTAFVEASEASTRFPEDDSRDTTQVTSMSQAHATTSATGVTIAANILLPTYEDDHQNDESSSIGIQEVRQITVEEVHTEGNDEDNGENHPIGDDIENGTGAIQNSQQEGDQPVTGLPIRRIHVDDERRRRAKKLYKREKYMGVFWTFFHFLVGSFVIFCTVVTSKNNSDSLLQFWLLNIALHRLANSGVRLAAFKSLLKLSPETFYFRGYSYEMRKALSVMNSYYFLLLILGLIFYLHSSECEGHPATLLCVTSAGLLIIGFIHFMLFFMFVIFGSLYILLVERFGHTEEKLSRLEKRKVEKAIKGLSKGRPPNDLLEKKGVCSICFLEFHQSDDVFKLKCDPRHVFHTSCSSMWFKKKPSCPICRKTILKERTHHHQES